MGISGLAQHSTRAEISLEALAHNYRELRRITSPSARMMAVVKADGYGHGAVQTARVALDNGADFLAVARITEAAHLRQAGITAPILLFGYSSPSYADFLISNDIRASINSLESAALLSDAALNRGDKIKAHIKVDTGMGRLGLLADELKSSEIKKKRNTTVKDILSIARMPGIEIEGIYMHFAQADIRDKRHARRQFELFSDILLQLEKHSLAIEIRHAANSAATIEMPETHLDMVRPGIAQYGLLPSDETDRTLIDLRPAMSLKSAVIHIKDVPAGFSVSYGSTWTSPAPTKIATVPIGYADGYSRLLSSKGSMIVKGHKVPIVGRICMDLCMIDVGSVPDIEIDDEVVIMGRQEGSEITADDIARTTGTINYEIVSTITSRVPRIYI